VPLLTPINPGDATGRKVRDVIACRPIQSPTEAGPTSVLIGPAGRQMHSGAF